MIADLFGVNDGVGDELVGVEIGAREFNSGDLVVVISRVVEDAALEVITGGIDGVFVFVIAKVAATVLLIDGVEDVEELADAGEFVGLIADVAGVGASESSADETGLGGEVAGKADPAHAAAVFLERNVWRESVFWGVGGEIAIVVKIEELLVEGRIVGENAGGVIVDFKAVFSRFDDDTGAGGVTQNPMEFGGGKVRTEGEAAQVEVFEGGAGFGDVSATAKDPGNKLELRNVVFAVEMIMVNGVADKVEPGHTETFFVDGIVEERVVSTRNGIGSDVSDADDGVMRIQDANFAEVEREVVRDNDSTFAVRKIVIKVATEIMIVSLISGGSAHVFVLFRFLIMLIIV